MPCSPPMAFCSTVGHAIFQTAARWGLRRSSDRTCGASRPAADGEAATAQPASCSSEPDPPAADGGRNRRGRHGVRQIITRRLSPHRSFRTAPHVGVREDDGGLALQRIEIAALESFAGLRRGQQLLDLIDQRRGVGVGRRRIRSRRSRRCGRRARRTSAATRTRDR